MRLTHSDSVHRFFFYLTILFLPTQLGYHIWPEWAHVLGRRVDYLSPTIYFGDLLIILTLVSWALTNKFSIFNFQFSNNSEFSLRKFLVPVVLIFFVVLNISLAISKPVAVYKWVKAFEFGLFGLYIVKTKPPIVITTLLLGIAGFYSSVIAIIQFVLQRSIGGSLWLLGERAFTIDTPGIARTSWCMPFLSSCPLLLRSYATFPHPNVLGGFLAVTLPLFLNLQINEKKIIQWIINVALVLGIIALGLTFSRSAWVAGAIGLIMANAKWQMLNGKNISQRSKTIFIFVICVLLLLITFVATSFDPTDESVVVRDQLNSVALTMWQHSPLFGVGLGNFVISLRPYFLSSLATFSLQPVHNIYLLLLSEVGIVGLGLLLFLLLKLQKGRFGIAMLLILLLGFVDHYPLSLQQGQLLLTTLIAYSFLDNKHG